MANHVPLFQFRLARGRSIGPLALRNLWSHACGSRDVSVSRELRGIGQGRQDHFYLLRGPPRMGDLENVETRLRVLLTEAMQHTPVTLSRLL